MTQCPPVESSQASVGCTGEFVVCLFVFIGQQPSQPPHSHSHSHPLSHQLCRVAFSFVQSAVGAGSSCATHACWVWLRIVVTRPNRVGVQPRSHGCRK